jgi:hypothetical protein
MSTVSRVTGPGLMMLVTVLALGCRSAATEATSSTVTLSNRSGDSLAVRMMELESSRLVDPVVGPVPLSGFGFSTIVPPSGESSRELESVSGYTTGSDLQVWVYRIRAGIVTAAAAFVVSDQALKSTKFRIEVAPSAR